MFKENKKEKIGIFGGTFNPPHTGHILVAETAIKQLSLDKLIIVPAGNPPHKEIPSTTPNAKTRFELTCLAFKHITNITISDIEISKQETSYAINTVNSILSDYPNALIYLLMGTDMYLTLETWHDAEELLSRVTPVVFSRSDEDHKSINNYSIFLENKYGVSTEIINNHIIDISSSELRNLLPLRQGTEYMNSTCYAYIIKKQLYGARPAPAWLRSFIFIFLDPERITHVLASVETAILLAKRWDIDPEEAFDAAILHDITKNFSYEQHLEVIKYHDIIVDIYKRNEVKLFHPKTGAIIAKTEFSVSDNVADAISWHTTGRQDMTTLEKIIYLADYIEPTRDFPNVDILRKLAYESLDDAMIMGLEITIEDLTSRGITPNSASLNALSDLRERKREQKCLNLRKREKAEHV